MTKDIKNDNYGINRDKTIIQTTKPIYPQIYAYILPDIESKKGWVKIGYTERQNVDERIKEQVHTAAIRLNYEKLWSAPARFQGSEETFKDKRFHEYLRTNKGIQQEPRSEWFFYNGTPLKSEEDFKDFISSNFSQVSSTLQYELRDEQREAVEKTIAYWKEKKELGKTEFLWNAKPRFGKTLTTYDLMRRLGSQKVLILTNRPAIANSWFDDFERFIAWQTNYAFVSTADSLSERNVLNRDQFLTQCRTSNKTDMVAFISLQDLKGSIYFGGRVEKFDWVKDLHWDLVVIDEAHEGVNTFKTDVLLKVIKRRYTLHLSGTPFKALAAGTFDEDAIYNWSYTDEQNAKQAYEQRIHQQTGIEAEDQINPYAELPILNLFTYQMSPMITGKVNEGAHIDGEQMDFAFDLNEFFSTNDDGKFIYEKEVKKWLDTLTSNEKYPFSTLELRDELKHTFWLLKRVASANALKKLLEKHPYFKDYEIILAAGDGKTDEEKEQGNTINQKALDKVKKAIKENDKTITLSVGQLTTGITIPEWSAVMMLSNLESPALYMQAAFRAQNPWKYEKDGITYRKENAYIFDFAPERTLMVYDEIANHLIASTAAGKGTTFDREENIRTLLNFFPVIAEDGAGKMVEINAQQVLTMPRAIKAAEVVKRGFMSNLLFQNISGIFAGEGAKEILQELKPIEQGKIQGKSKTNNTASLNIEDVALDEKGNAFVEPSLVINQTEARFGEKVYAPLQMSLTEQVEQAIAKVEQAAEQKRAPKESDTKDISKAIAETFDTVALESAKELAKENNLTEAVAKKIVKQQVDSIAEDFKSITFRAQTEQNSIAARYDSEIKKAIQENNPDFAEQLREEVKQKQAAVIRETRIQLQQVIEEKPKAAFEQSTQQILQKAEEKKKTTVEDDVRARLRGFSRTIPSFLMAYGHEQTTLATFDQAISPEVFKEVTGITLEQFRILRDDYQFFDSMVFDSAVTEFLNKRRELSNYFETDVEEDIFDYIPPQKTNQIFTPKRVVRLMLDALEQENPGIFSNPDYTFADPYMKSGLYITEIVKRLYIGLESLIPDKEQRLKHIFEKQVYGFAPTPIIYDIAKSFVMGFDEGDHREEGTIKHNLILLDTTPYAKKEKNFTEKLRELYKEKENMKFDVIVGNPPYQEDNNDDGTRANPEYHYFYNLAEEYAEKYCLISPARFLFNAGQTPKAWNEKMLKDEHLKVVLYKQISGDIFPNTDIKGGIAIIYRDASSNFGSIDSFASHNELNSILRKVTKRSDFKEIGEIIFSSTSYRFTEQLIVDYPQFVGRVKKTDELSMRTNVFDRYPEVFSDIRTSDSQIEIYGRQNGERVAKYIEACYIQDSGNLNYWKIFIPAANGSGAIGEVLSTPLIGEPLIGHTQTFMGIGAFETREEAENCIKYIRSKFARTMLGILKITQHNPRETWAKVPLQDFTAQSDINWNCSIAEIDAQLYEKYGLDEKEIAFIEEKVRAMD